MTMQRAMGFLLSASCLFLSMAARADTGPTEAVADQAPAAQDRDSGAFTTQAIGTVDTTSVILVGTRWYVFDDMDLRDHLVGGTFLIDAQGRITDRFAVGGSLTVPFMIERGGKKLNGGAFGNPALWARGNVLDDGMNRLGLSMTLYLPALWNLSDEGAFALAMGMTAGNYEMARYMPASLSLRPDVRYQFNYHGLLVNTEFGFDFMFTFEHDGDNVNTPEMTSVGLHAGLNVGYQILGAVTPFVEMQLSRLLRVGPHSSFDDFDTYVAIGPGVHLALGPFLGDFYAMIPVSKDYRNAIDAIIGFRLGGRL
jgi:hypothetical protein